eukprot:gene18711-25233_t
MVWFQKQDIMCDLSIVDHNKETALTDLINTIKVTTIGKVIMANEMYGFEEDWDKVVKAGYISKSKCDEIAAAKRKWCFGTVAKHKGSLDGEILIATETDFQFNVLSGSALPYTTPPGNPLGMYQRLGSLDGDILSATETDFEFDVLSGSVLTWTTPPGNPLD